MKFTDREITSDEYNKICEDFRKIEIDYGITDSNNKRINITVEEEEKVVGFASGLINHEWFNLTDLWIIEEYRGKGLGAKILGMIEEKAKAEGVKHSYTWTTAYNSNEKFYEKQGYKQCLVFEDYFGIKGGHHICLRKDFNS